MSFLDRVVECTAHDPSRYVPFTVDGHAVGHVRKDRLDVLARWDDVFVVDARGVALRDADARGARDAADARDASAHDTRGARACAARSAVFARAAERLAAAGCVPRLTGEMYAVAPRFGAPPWFAADRATIPFFGLRAHGVHLHGIVHAGGERRLWIARRAAGRTTFPGMLDNMVAGGQPMGLSLRDNLAKECREEAGIPAALARAARPTGAVHYRVDVDAGLRDDVLFLFELDVPADFVPRNTDGEVEAFELWTVQQTMDAVAESRAFKFNCNLALIDLFLRHGDIGPEHEDYLELLRGLHGHAPRRG